MKIILDENKKVYGLSKEDKTDIMNDLMVENPAYINALKYSGYNRISLPKYLSYYEEGKDHIAVPIGYELPVRVDEIIDNRKEITVDYPNIDIVLREVQEEAMFSYLEDPNKGMMCLATGMGKSILGVYLAHALKQRTLVIVHKNDLVIGWNKDIKKAFKGEVKPGLIKAQDRIVGDQITIATIQTLSRMKEEELEQYLRLFGMIIIDECHHTPASTYSIISKFSSPYKIGLSATPERSDGLDKVMHYYLGDFCYVSTESDEDGVILPVEVRVRNSNAFYIPSVKKEGSKYVLATEEDKNEVKVDIDSVPYKIRPRISHFALDDEVQRDEKYQETYLKDILREFKEGHSIIVFLSQKEHCRLVQSLLEDRGVPSDKIQLYYGDSTEPKEELMKRAEEERNLITIATYSIATEGTNVKQWEVAFLLSSVNNGKNVEQAIGRIRRVDDNKLDEVRVYDYRFPNVYTFNRHGMTRDKRYLKLNFKIDRVRRSV